MVICEQHVIVVPRAYMCVCLCADWSASDLKESKKRERRKYVGLFVITLVVVVVVVGYRSTPLEEYSLYA